MKKKTLPVLLTPLVLAVNPVEVDASQWAASYSHETQVNSTTASGAPFTVSTSTFNGTQTFDMNGRPWDNDSDSDADPY